VLLARTWLERKLYSRLPKLGISLFVVLQLCVFRALGLARVGTLAPTPNIVRDRGDIDADTVRALFTNRMHVLREYRRRVIRPVFRELTKQESVAVLVRSSVQLLVRHPKLLDERARQQLRELLDRYEVLRTVIEFRDRLQQLWDETSASHARAGAIARAVHAG
jgi:stearoyl-CoA desaturase (delta-9 desaturase)